MITGIIIKNNNSSTIFQIGDLVTITVGTDSEYIPDEKWIIDGYEQKWISSNSLLIDNSQIQASYENGLHKILLPAMIQKPGPISLGPLEIRRINDNTVEKTKETNLGETDKITLAQEEKPVWYTPLIPRGGINYYTLGILILLVSFLIFLLLRFFKNREQEKTPFLNPKQQALQSLQELQKFSRESSENNNKYWKDFAYSLVKIIRIFVRKNFDIPIDDLTDQEFVEKLKEKIDNENTIIKIDSILKKLDGVRFGQQVLQHTEIPQLILETRSFIETTFVNIKEQVNDS